MDKKVELLQAAASSAGKSSSVADELAAYSPAVPPTPPTEAVLLTMPPAGDFPGAQFRLAGDRCGSYLPELCVQVEGPKEGGDRSGKVVFLDCVQVEGQKKAASLSQQWNRKSITAYILVLGCVHVETEEILCQRTCPVEQNVYCQSVSFTLLCPDVHGVLHGISTQSPLAET